MKVYMIEDLNGRPGECTMYSDLAEAMEDFGKRLESLEVGTYTRWTITALEMTQEEFNALPELA